MGFLRPVGPKDGKAKLKASCWGSENAKGSPVNEEKD